ncbi:hypothetical protein EYC80_005264 [Monilinia laxa]|uniref:Uncharacterized protein n=1 Tax=Monilinia laxa TaxID=61186 RepID=A0A5N6KL20_MONLA|nr:hypothetical protein EYC80_005264 [Monilinia laxa]
MAMSPPMRPHLANTAGKERIPSEMFSAIITNDPCHQVIVLSGEGGVSSAPHTSATFMSEDSSSCLMWPRTLLAAVISSGCMGLDDVIFFSTSISANL